MRPIDYFTKYVGSFKTEKNYPKTTWKPCVKRTGSRIIWLLNIIIASYETFNRSPIRKQGKITAKIMEAVYQSQILR